MGKRISKSKGLIGRLYDDANKAEKAMFRAELLKAQELTGNDYPKRFRDHYQYCEHAYDVLSIYLDSARKHLGYVDTLPLAPTTMLSTLKMELAA
ncbi:hypothetical protein [Spirosoma linguale]|uniref:Uncharacterized protein n=1 Tax=Spirosoma linguale (strain ATCC 33905 / DSM 74 / LMG 10896 / Claus 1) TaxID=504472 RepID=D2QGZ3_SPILD|nr:hypothetical protein Slin_0696 [Spirosoma linguale DSM 74]